MNQMLENAMQHWNKVAPVISTPTNEQDYLALLNNIEEAMEIVGGRKDSPLSGLIASMANAATEYESERLNSLDGGSLEALQYLIKLHSVKQTELKEIGSQGVVSEVLSGKRSLTLRHIKALSKRFNVSPNVFISND